MADKDKAQSDAEKKPGGPTVTDKNRVPEDNEDREGTKKK